MGAQKHVEMALQDQNHPNPNGVNLNAPGAGGGGGNGNIVHHVDENDFRNMRLSIGALGRNAIFDVKLSDNLEGTRNIEIRLVRQANGPQAAAAAAAAGAAAQEHPPAPGFDPEAGNNNVEQVQAQAPVNGVAPGDQGGEHNQQEPPAAPPRQGRLIIKVAADDEDKEYLDKMRGWLMTVATLFVNMAFQAVLHPPDWLSGEWFIKDQPKHGTVGAPISAPAPAPTSHAADGKRGELARATWYLIFNTMTFATALALAQALLWKTSNPRLTMKFARFLMLLVSFCVAFTYAIGSSDDWRGTEQMCVFVVWYAFPTALGFLVSKITRPLLTCCMNNCKAVLGL